VTLVFDGPVATARPRHAYDRRFLSADGYLSVDPTVIMASGVRVYDGDEIGQDPRKRYRVWVSPRALRCAADSFKGVPLLDQHRASTADDHPFDAVIGVVNGVKFDGEKLVGSVAIWPRRSVISAQAGLTPALSAGYNVRVEMTPGTTPAGERYDGVLREIRANHVALVNESRGGDAVLLAHDSIPRRDEMADYDDYEDEDAEETTLIKGILFLYQKLGSESRNSVIEALRDMGPAGAASAEAAMDSRRRQARTRRHAMDAANERSFDARFRNARRLRVA
jgi:hypothetical protein